MNAERRYWDSNCFIGYFANEADKIDRINSGIKAAKAGLIVIVTSALTLVEVIKLKSKTPLPPEKEPVIRAFFKHEWIKVRNLERKIAELARELVWQRGIDPKDAVHVATALMSQVAHFDTFDDGLFKHSGTLGQPPLPIGLPNVPEQFDLPIEGPPENRD